MGHRLSDVLSTTEYILSKQNERMNVSKPTSKDKAKKKKVSLAVLVNKTFRAVPLGNLKKLSYINKKIMPVSAMSC